MGDFLFWQHDAHAQDLHLAVGMSSGRLDQRLSAGAGGSVLRGDRLRPPYSLVVEVPEQTDPELWKGISLEPAVGRVSIPGPLNPPPWERVQRIHLAFRLRHEQQGDLGSPLVLTIWVHERLERIWLTPRALTVRTGHLELIRPSLLARFVNAGTPLDADVTSWLPGSTPEAGDETFAHAVGQSVPLVAFSATTPVGIIETTGKFVVVDLEDGSDPSPLDRPPEATLTASLSLLPSVPSVGDTSMTLDIVPAWATTPAPLSFVGGAGEALAEQVPNVLILPDGFLAEDEAVFRDLVNDLVHDLQTESLLQPLPLLADRINYWSAWVPSRQRGISELIEGSVDGAGLYHVGFRPTPSGARADIQEVQYEAGRVLLNLNDTAFHLIRGERRRAVPDVPDRLTRLDPDLTSEADLELFLAALTHPAAPVIGTRWLVGGADQANVVIIGCLAWNGGANQSRGTGRLASLTSGQGGSLPAIRRDDGVDLALEGIPRRPRLDLASLVAHELGHSWGLGDEYTEAGVTFPQRGFTNLQTRAEVSDASTGRLDGSRVRWAWPRLDAAALLTAPPVLAEEPLEASDPSWRAGARVLVTVPPEQADLFRVGNLVRVRTRPLLTAVTSAQHRITAIARRAADDAVELEPVEGLSDLLEPAGLVPFTTGSLLILPRLDDDLGPVVAELSMVHQAVLEHLTARSNPLNAAATDGQDRPCRDDESRSPPVLASNLPPGLAMPRMEVPSWRLVGLFEGGGRVQCGVYHPSGGCLMNRRLADEGEVDDLAQAVPFCAVCRYILVDLLDPPAHPLIDEQYDEIYPVFSPGGRP